MSDSCYARELDDAAEAWTKAGRPTPDVILVAGSGVGGDFGRVLSEPMALSSLTPFPVAGISGHALEIEVLRLPFVGASLGEAATADDDSEGLVALCCRGRLHAYQGFTPHQVVFTMRLAALLGAQIAVVTNAAGGLYEGVEAGDLALISDHINLTGLNPLRGSLPSEWGPQFPDMCDAYDPWLRDLAREHAEKTGIALREAVYVGVLGPSYETPAEIRAFGTMGGGLVGMSTVLEVTAARHMGLRCLGLSLVTNAAAGIGGEVLDHDDVLDIGKRAAGRVQTLLRALLSDPRIAAISS